MVFPHLGMSVFGELCGWRAVGRVLTFSVFRNELRTFNLTAYFIFGQLSDLMNRDFNLEEHLMEVLSITDRGKCHAQPTRARRTGKTKRGSPARDNAPKKKANHTKGLSIINSMNRKLSQPTANLLRNIDCPGFPDHGYFYLTWICHFSLYFL